MTQDIDDLRLPEAHFYYIAHLLDKVLVGEHKDLNFQEVIEAIHQKRIIEVHFFNEVQATIISLEADKVIVYEPIMHHSEGIDRHYVLETTRLEMPRWGNYRYLHARDYLAYDEGNHLAYVKHTALVKLYN